MVYAPCADRVGKHPQKDDTPTQLNQTEQHLMCNAAMLAILPTFSSYRHQGKLQPVIRSVECQQLVKSPSCVESRLRWHDALDGIDVFNVRDDPESGSE